MSIAYTCICYSHGVMVTVHNRDAMDRMFSFLSEYELKETKRLPNRRYVTEIKKVFYGVTRNKRYFFIHRNTFPLMLLYMRDKGYTDGFFKITEVSPPIATNAVLTINPKFIARDYQEAILEHACSPIYSSRIDLQTGKGKLQSLDSKIKVPGGWSTMGEMKVGTEVIAPDGTITRVNGVFPQGMKMMYKVIFADGRSTEAGAEHLWRVYYVNTVPHLRWRVVNTLEVIRLISMPNPRVYVQLIESEKQPNKVLPLPPYTLGVLLGDGGLGSGSINISKLDEDLFERVETELPETLKIVKCDNVTRRIVGNKHVNTYKRTLRDLGLMGKKSPEKFIPVEYFDGSHEQRLALLQGLMDTDGTVNTIHSGGSISFNSTSYQLALGVQYLVRSLGGIASISDRQTYFTHNGEKRKGLPSFDVNIRYKKPSDLFHIKRKKDRTNDTNQYSDVLKLRVSKIEEIGYKEAQCISIEHPDHLYITDDFIVTHNTAISLMCVQRLAERTVIMIPPKYFGLWIAALEDVYVGISGRYITVSGSSELQMLIFKALENDLDVDFIIISMITYRNYIEYYEQFGDEITETAYLVPPYRFHETIKAGVQINDEIQEDPGLVFRIDTYTNIKKQLYLSATPYTGNDMVTRMINHMLPQETSVSLPKLDVYSEVIAILYDEPGIQPKDYLVPFKRTFNHARYEKRLLLNQKRLSRYYSLVKRLLYGVFYKSREKGQKALILCSTVVFIEKLTSVLQQEYPDLKITSFVSGSDYNKALECDVIVSTIKSAGTGVDIPDLRETILLQFTDSKKDNIQILGRLRKLKNYPDVTPRLTYLVCTNIPASMKYHANKKQHFGGRVLNHRTMRV